MKARKIASLLLLAAMLFSCTSNDTADIGTDSTTPETAQMTDTEAAPPKAVLLFEDNFDGTELDSTKFMRCPEWKRQGELCIWDEDMSYLDGEGHLVLRAEWDEKKGRVKSGGVRSEGIFTAGYAYYEASIAFPVAYGIWGAFWMMCGDVYAEDGSAADGVDCQNLTQTFAVTNRLKLGVAPIPYRSLIPKGSDDIIVAGRCVAADGQALGPARIMSTCMAMGQAAGTATVLKFRDSLSYRDIDVQELRSQLRAAGAEVDC